MSTAATAVAPAERQDIHKSCRTIEALLSILNDYCEAASAFATIQKKLSKALKDAAGLKMNVQFAASAFGASAGILEVLADVDSKFAKIADRERSNVNSEVKKWLKKLAKEEKAHDQRMEESNARIKQAGQAYEKKSKKGARDTSEEHARYINLLSVIGPEMSQEKFNHAVHVTQQHTSVTFHVAAGLSRIADAEWVRTCESMRRISPTVGQLGEWRALCEGSWTGPLPDDLPEFSREAFPAQGSGVSEWGQTGLSTPLRRFLPVPPVGNNSPGSVSVSASATTTLDPPRSPVSMVSQNQGSINSITTLSAFPFPPTHFPIPLASTQAELQRQQAQLQNIQLVQSRAGSPNLARSQATLVPLAHVLTDSPKAMEGTALGEPFVLDTSKSLHSSQVTRTPPKMEQPSTDTRAKDEAAPEATAIPLESKEGGVSGGDPHRPSLIGLGSETSDKSIRPVSPFKRAEQASSDKEFGIQFDVSSRSVFKSHSVDSATKDLERTDSTNSAGNNVAALRNKYVRTVEIPSHGPKDIPRLPMSVSEIISRYQPLDEPLSPRRTASPTVDRFPLPVETPARQSARDVPTEESEIRRRKQRIEELAELELKEKEYELRQRERELEQRARDFERDKQQFLNFRPEPSNASDGPKGPRNSPFRHKRGSQSVSNFNPTSSTSSSSITRPRPSPSRSPSRSTLLPPKDHAPFCGCDTCSVSKYKAIDVSPAPHNLRPPEPPIVIRPERPKGWIRRLSMPSVNIAFSLDARKNASVVSLKSGLPLPAENGRLRGRSFEQGISNRTLTGIGR